MTGAGGYVSAVSRSLVEGNIAIPQVRHPGRSDGDGDTHPQKGRGALAWPRPSTLAWFSGARVDTFE